MSTTAILANDDMRARVEAFNWAATPCGAPDQWPASLRAALTSCLAARVPMALWVGTELVLCYNDAWQALLGKTSKASLGSPGPAAFAEYWPAIGPALQEVFASGQATFAQDVVLPVAQARFSEERAFTWFISPIHDEAGHVLGLTTALTPGVARAAGVESFLRPRATGQAPKPSPAAAARAQVEQAITQLEAMLDHLPLGLAFFDRELRYVRVNAELARLNGRPAAEHSGQPLEAMLPDSAPTLRPRIEQVFTTGVGLYDVEISGAAQSRPHDQRYALASWYPVTLDGETVLVGAVVQDITERKRAEAALQQSQHFLERLTEAVPSVIYVYDLQANRNLYANRQLWEILGYTPEEAQALDADFLPTVLHPEDWAATPAHIGRLLDLKDGEVLEREYRIQHRNGQWRWFFGREMVFARDRDGRPTEILGSTLDITARKEAEQALRASKANLDLALSTAELGTWDWDVVQDRYTWDAAQYRIFGVQPEQFVISLEAIWAATHPDDRQQLQARAQQALETGQPYQSEFRIVRPNGEVRWCIGGVGITRDAQGRVVRMSGITYDITERQRAEQRMANLQRLSEALTGAITRQDVYIVIQQQTAAAFSADAIFLRFPSPEGDALVAETLHVGGRQNEAAIRTFDRLPATLPHPANEAFLSGQPVFLPDVAALSARYPQLAELVHNSGAQAAMHLPLVRDGQAFGVISLAFSAARSFREADHTFAIAFADRCAVALERAMLHESLAASEKQLRLVTDGLPALIAYVDRERRYQFVNKTYSEWFGLQREAVIGRPVWELLGQAAYQAAKADIDQALAGQEVSYERRMPYNRGGARFVQTSLIPDRALDGTVKGFFALIIDLSERKRAEEALHAAMQREQSLRARAEEASRLKDEFLATVSHELRTPLTAFLGYAQMLQTRKRDEAYVNRTVEKMIRSARAQAQLIEDLLDMARIVSGRLRIDPAPVDLGAVLLAALDTVRPALEAKQLRLQSDLGPDPAIVVGDANRLQQVAWNLLANAVKFTPPGGLISVHLEADRREARLAVGDTGQGISPEFLPYVFDRFRQADGASNRTTSGLGIGLALVRHLVELHGGSVEAHSAGLGQGATFSVRLPLAPDGLLALHESEPRLALDDQESCPPELDGLRVLIVDDQPELLELLHEIMASCGCEVRACNNAQAALATLRAWQPEVLISDLAMPGQDGYWLISQVRALPPEQGGAVPALALTAYVRVEDRLRVLAAGFEQYVPKPIEPAELRDVVAQLARRVEA